MILISLYSTTFFKKSHRKNQEQKDVREIEGDVKRNIDSVIFSINVLESIVMTHGVLLIRHYLLKRRAGHSQTVQPLDGNGARPHVTQKKMIINAKLLNANFRLGMEITLIINARPMIIQMLDGASQIKHFLDLSFS